MGMEARWLSALLVLTSAWVHRCAVLPLSVGVERGGQLLLKAECSDDGDCDPHQFCYKSGLCADCTVCSVYYRLQAETPCPRHPLQCGACKPGFIAEVLSNNAVRDSCVKSHTTNSSNSHSGSGSSPTLSDSLALGIALSLILLVLIVCVCVWRCSRLQQYRGSNIMGFLSKSRVKVTEAFVGYKNEQNADSKTHQNKDAEPSAPLIEKTRDSGSIEAARTSAQLNQTTCFRTPDYQHPQDQPFYNRPSAPETPATAPPAAEPSTTASSAAAPLLSALLSQSPSATNAENQHHTPCFEQTVNSSSCSSSQSVIRNYNFVKVELVQATAGRPPPAPTTAAAVLPARGSSAVHLSI